MTAFAGAVSAQIGLQPNLPAVGLIQKDRLWDVFIVNSTAASYDCRLELVLQDRTTGQEVFTATSALIRVAPGGMQVNRYKVEPVQYNYLLAGAGNRLQELMPAGNYTVCYTLTDYAANRAVAEECTQFDSEPLSSPMLVFPADNSELQNSSVQFSWAPPTPYGMFGRLRYELMIAEVADGQQPAEAIQQNVPFYTVGNLPNNALNYPPSAATFDKDKLYAWQVVARDGGNYAGKSETWTFSIKTDTVPSASTPNRSYIVIKNNKELGEGIHNITENTLYFKYYSFDMAHESTIKFLNAEGRVIREVKQQLVYGDNFLSFKVDRVFKKNDVYSVEITDAGDNKHTALFSIQ